MTLSFLFGLRTKSILFFLLLTKLAWVTCDKLRQNKKSDAKKAYQDVVDVGATDIFGEEKTLLFIQALDNKEYKIDYSKVGTSNFIKIHQQTYI
jgi:hypothetical protein